MRAAAERLGNTKADAAEMWTGSSDCDCAFIEITFAEPHSQTTGSKNVLSESCQISPKNIVLRCRVIAEVTKESQQNKEKISLFLRIMLWFKGFCHNVPNAIDFIFLTKQHII